MLARAREKPCKFHLCYIVLLAAGLQFADNFCQPDLEQEKTKKFKLYNPSAKYLIVEAVADLDKTAKGLV